MKKDFKKSDLIKAVVLANGCSMKEAETQVNSVLKGLADILINTNSDNKAVLNLVGIGRFEVLAGSRRYYDINDKKSKETFSVRSKFAISSTLKRKLLKRLGK